MNSLRIVVVVLAIFEAGWMTFDGARALVVGDYVTPKTGPNAGQLGPWQPLVRAVGVPPRSTLMKLIFAAYGAAWLVIVTFFFRGAPWAPQAMRAAASGALWYLPIGTLYSVLQIAALLWLRREP